MSMSLRLNRQEFSWYFPIFFVIVVSIGVVSSYYVYISLNTSLRQSLIYRAETIALALDSQTLTALAGHEDDTFLAEYQSLKERLVNIRNANKDSRFVYLMGMKDEIGLYFIADSEDPESEDYSPPGQAYEEGSIAFEDAFESRVSGSEGPTSDRWGTWITGVAPILNDQGDVIAAVGIDVDAQEFRNQIFTYTALPLIATFILIVFVYFGMRLRRQEHQFLEIKSKFVAIASHDIRSPLTGISWALQSLIESKHLSAEDKHLAEEITDQVQHLLVTANDVLDALSIDVPKVNLLRVELKLKDIIARSLESLKFFARQKEITITVAPIPDWAVVIGDQSKLLQLFINVISNSIKYSRKGQSISLVYEEHEDAYAISVIDQGIGIPKEEQLNVFKGFYRARNAEATSIHGTGLGLYLVRRIAELHDGSVELTSEENKGTKITVLLPRIIKDL